MAALGRPFLGTKPCRTAEGGHPTFANINRLHKRSIGESCDGRLMMKQFVCPFLFAVATWLIPLFTSQAAEPTPPEGFRAIFNGKDLSGWYGLNPHSVDKLTGEKREAALQQMRDDFPNHWRIEN